MTNPRTSAYMCNSRYIAVGTGVESGDQGTDTRSPVQKGHALFMKWSALLAVVAAIVGFAAPAQAQSVREGYGGRADVLGEVGTVDETNEPTNQGQPTQNTTEAPVAQPQSVADGLPFTGADVGLLLAGGLMLVGAGVVLRRLAYREHA